MSARPTAPPPPPPRPAGPSTPPPPAGPKSDPARLYSVAELAALWGCGKDAIYALISRGALAVVDIGTARKPKTRISSAEADAYIARNTRRAPRRAAA